MQRPARPNRPEEPRARGPGAGAHPDGADRLTNSAKHDRGTLIGRTREREAITATLVAGQAGQAALLVVGDAGIGKTALTGYAIREARATGFRVLHAAGGEVERDLPHAALGDLFGDELWQPTEARPEAQREVLAQILGRGTGAVTVEPRTVALATLDLLEQLGADAPLALVLDDVHWLDAASGRALTFALRRVRVPRLAIIATQRRARSLPLRLRSVWPDQRVRTLELGPLTPDELDDLLAVRLGHLPRAPILHRIIELSGGHPLLALELAQLADDDMTILERLDPDRLSGQAGALIGRRLADLSPRQITTLATVALMSGPTDAELAAIGIAPDELRAGRDARLLLETDGRWSFTHPLIRAAASAGLTTAERRALHTRLAEHATDPVAKANHVAQSVTTPDEPSAAIVEAGAREANRRGAPLEAADLAEHALSLTEPAARTLRFERLLMAGVLRRNAGELPAARTLLEAALAEAPPGDPRARVLLELALLDWLATGHGPTAHLRSALRSAQTDALRAEIHLELADSEFRSRDASLAARHARLAARDAERADDPALLARVLGRLATREFMLGGRLDEQLIDRILQLERSVGPLYAPGRSHESLILVAGLLTWAGELQRARTMLDELNSRQPNLPWADHEGTADLAWVELWMGDWDRADRRLEELRRVMEVRGEDATSSLAIEAQLVAHRGDPAAPGLIRRVERIGEAAGRWRLVASMRGLLGAWWLGQGDAEAAAECLDRSITIEWRLRPIVQDSALIFPVAIEALALAGRPQDARALATEIGRRTRRWEARMFRAGMARATALLAMVEGRPDKAATLLRPWLEGGELADLPFLRARAELVLGQVLRRQRHRTEARAMLEQARDRFRTLGAVAWTERAEEQLARLGDRPGSTFGLTATEQRIAALAVAGKTNRVIADTLVVSVKTVEWNLTKVYEKVGVHSRAELAARFVGDASPTGEAALVSDAVAQQASARLT